MHFDIPFAVFYQLVDVRGDKYRESSTRSFQVWSFTTINTLRRLIQKEDSNFPNYLDACQLHVFKCEEDFLKIPIENHKELDFIRTSVSNPLLVVVPETSAGVSCYKKLMCEATSQRLFFDAAAERLARLVRVRFVQQKGAPITMDDMLTLRYQAHKLRESGQPYNEALYNFFTPDMWRWIYERYENTIASIRHCEVLRANLRSRPRIGINSLPEETRTILHKIIRKISSLQYPRDSSV